MNELVYQVWDETNTTYISTLDEATAGEFVDEYNGTGFGTVTVPVGSSDAALLLKDRVVRVQFRGETRFSWFIETREYSIATSTGSPELKVSGRGLLGWLEDAVVYPQGGLADFNAPDRPFNYASSSGGGWRSSGNYQDALGVRWKDDTTARAKLPVRWKDSLAQWVWRTDPETAVQRGTVNWFYKDFTVSERKRIKFYASCDNSMEVWLDGALIMSSSDFDQESASFTQMAKFTVRLGAGEHTIAARVKNDRPWTRYDAKVDADNDKISVPDHGLANGTEVIVTDKNDADGLSKGSTYYVRQKTDDDFKLATTNSDTTIVNITKDGDVDLKLKTDNTAGFILTGLVLNSNGKETDTVEVRTNTSWQVSSVEPYWRPAQILKVLTQEAAGRGVYRLGGLSYSFNSTSPTSGSWSTEVDLSLRVGSTLLTVFDDMVDLGNDFWLNPVTLELDAWESRGVDRSADVLLDTGVNLVGYSTRVERPIKTVAVVRTKDGWLRAANSAQRTAKGWREVFIEYGNTKSEATAKRRALKHLRRTGKTQVAATGVELAVVDGAVPYVDFDVADVVSISDASGGAGLDKARVLSVSLSESGGVLKFAPELEVITSA